MESANELPKIEINSPNLFVSESQFTKKNIYLTFIERRVKV